MKEIVQIKEYLLDLSKSEEQRHQIELRMLTDPLWLEEISMAEEGLIDDYLDGSLSEQERLKFETYFLLTPRRRMKLTLATALCSHAVAGLADESAADIPLTLRLISFFRDILKFNRLVITSGVVVILAVSGYIALHALRQSDDRKPPIDRIAGRSLNIREVTPPLTSVELTPGQIRGEGELTTVRITDEIKTIQLQLLLIRDEYGLYQASLKSGGAEESIGHPVESSPLGKGRAVTLNIPASYLLPGDYILRLSGLTRDQRLEAVGSYPFRLLKK